jgi:pyruvate-ferredoxin/flavodoxin oxidoreductase
VSIIIAYSPCIAHGVDLSFNLRQQDLAVKSGHWPLLRYDPRLRAQGRTRCRSTAPHHPSPSRLRPARGSLHGTGTPAPGRCQPSDERSGTAARSRHQEYTDLAALALPGSATTAAEENKNA